MLNTLGIQKRKEENESQEEEGFVNMAECVLRPRRLERGAGKESQRPDGDPEQRPGLLVLESDTFIFDSWPLA